MSKGVGREIRRHNETTSACLSTELDAESSHSLLLFSKLYYWKGEKSPLISRQKSLILHFCWRAEEKRGCVVKRFACQISMTFLSFQTVDETKIVASSSLNGADSNFP